MWYIKSTPPWYVDRDVSIRNSLRSNYDTSTRCTYSSLEPLGSTCSRARYQQRELLSTWYDLVRYMQAPNRLGDVGEARWPLSHRWTDTSSTLPDAAHDSRNQGGVVSLSELSLLSACVRLCQLREVHHSLQQSLNPLSRTQSAATDGSPACCTSSLMLRVCVMLRVLPSQSSVRSLLALLLYKQRCLSWLARPVCLGHYRPLQRRSASDKCSVRCRPMKQRDKIYRNF